MTGVDFDSDLCNPSLRPHSLISLQMTVRHHKPAARKVAMSVLVVGWCSCLWQLIGWQRAWYMVGS